MNSITIPFLKLISFGNLVSGSAGINGVVLSTSSLYRYQTWLMFILIGLFVGTSMLFIPLFGINGAALAAMISNIIYSMLGVLLAGKRFGLWPYSMVHLRITLVGLVAMAAGYIMPQMALIPDVLIRSVLVTLICTAGVWFWKLSDDLTGLAESLMERIRRKQ